MHASTIPSLLLLLLAGTATTTVIPGLRARADATEPWVTVDTSGHPKTVTPIQTTISGTPTVLSAAPEAVTATVFTQTNYGEVSTVTATAPNPTPTSGEGAAGAFPVCHNRDGPNAPFCLPGAGKEMYPGTTYYITWDPTFFNGSNTTVKLAGSYFNATTGTVSAQAFSSGILAAAWSFYVWTVDAELLKSQGASAVNISLAIVALVPGAAAMTPFQGPVVLVTNPPAYTPQKTKAPTGPALYIGLPTVAGFVILCVVGTCLWNRHTRRITIGNVMGRGRGGYGVGKSRRQRMGFGKKTERKQQGIRLMERDVDVDDRRGGGAGESGGVYRDVVSPRQERTVRTGERRESEYFEYDMPRRDSDALGSLAGSPTEDKHHDFGQVAAKPSNGGNAFRDELSRQDRERL